MTGPCRACGLMLLALLSAASLPSGTAVAQTKLPWADANPLQRLFGKPGETRRRPVRRSRVKPAHAAVAAVPSIAAVPVPEARPGAEGEALALNPSTTPSPDPKTEQTVPETASKAATPALAGAAAAPATADDAPEAAKPEAPTSRESPARPDDPALSNEKQDKEPSAEIGGAAASSADVPADAASAGASSRSETIIVPADPSETAEKPLSEIPVPDERPGDAAADAPKPVTSDPTAAGANEEKTPLPPEADDAPNSTDRLKSRVPTIDPAVSVLAAAAVSDAEACEAELTRRGVDFSVDDSIAEGECGVLRPVNVQRLSTGVDVSPKTQMLCRTALALDDWMRDGVVPAAKAGFPKDELREFRHASTYVCRPRASEGGISEHARGSAIDIAGFVFGSGKEIGIAAQPEASPEAAFQVKIRQAACGPFRTVLGPGTDADHATHFHLDIAARKNAATYCK